MTTVQVKNLTTPFKFSVPLSSAQQNDSSYVQTCVYYNEASKNWVQNECPSVQTTPDQIICCSYHMTQFAVHAIKINTSD